MEILYSYEKCQKIGFGRGLGQVRVKNALTQTIPDKIFGTKKKKSNKTGQEKKGLVPVFA